MPDDTHSQVDHDLIIKLDTKVDILTRKVDDMASSIVSRVDKTELLLVQLTQIADTSTKNIADHEARVRVIETIQNQSKGIERVIMATISFVAATVVTVAEYLLTKGK